MRGANKRCVAAMFLDAVAAFPTPKPWFASTGGIVASEPGAAFRLRGYAPAALTNLFCQR